MVPPPAPDEPYSLAAGIGQIQANDPTFDEKGFLQGAKAAFGMIVTAFAQGDTPTLRPLLSDDVYDNFAAAIRSRQASGESLETRVIDIRDADLIEARMEGRTAFVTIKFISEQINVTRDKRRDHHRRRSGAAAGSRGYLDLRAQYPVAQPELDADRNPRSQLIRLQLIRLNQS